MILRWFEKKIFFRFFGRNPRLWLTLEAAPYIQSVYPYSCTISTYRSTTSPQDFIIALLVWLQWWSKVFLGVAPMCNSKLRVAKLSFLNHKIQKTFKLGHVISPWSDGLGSNFGWFLESAKPCQLKIFRQIWANSTSSGWKLDLKRLHFG